jgi:hypothetical protein
MDMARLHRVNMVRAPKRHRTYALCALLIASLLLGACRSSTSQASANPTATLPAKWHGVNPGAGDPTVTPPASLSPRSLPAFSDARVAYIGPDALLHVVSLDGKTNLAGTPIPLTGFMGNGFWTAGTSPDGKQLAYFEDSRVTTIDAASGTRKTSPILKVGDSAISWAPGQRYLALSGSGEVMCVNVANLTAFFTPQDTAISSKLPTIDGPDGWIDAAHVAITQFPDISGTPGTHGLATPAPSAGTWVTLASLDVVTNQVRPITTIRGYGDHGYFSVVPGGQWTLFVSTQDTQAQITPYTPLAALINNATGAVTPLHHLTSLLSQGSISSLLWRPNSTQAIVAGAFGPGVAPYYLIDALRDTATPLSLSGAPEAWSPDGSTLIMAAGSSGGVSEDSAGWKDVGAVGAGLFTLTAVRIGMDGSMSPSITLTTHAMNIPLLGFVHTA